MLKLFRDRSSVSNPDSCPDADSYMVDTTLSQATIQRIYSTLTTAAVANKEVKVVLSGCESNRPRIKTVTIK